MIEIGKQLALFLDNRPGTLSRVCAVLAKEKINIYAISTSDTVDHIVVRLVLSDPQRAMRVFEDHGTLAISTEVLMLDGANKPGTLAEIASKLAKAKINIDYAYCATSPTANKGLLVLRTNNPKRALKVLNS